MLPVKALCHCIKEILVFCVTVRWHTVTHTFIKNWKRSIRNFLTQIKVLKEVSMLAKIVVQVSIITLYPTNKHNYYLISIFKFFLNSYEGCKMVNRRQIWKRHIKICKWVLHVWDFLCLASIQSVLPAAGNSPRQAGDSSTIIRLCKGRVQCWLWIARLKGEPGKTGQAGEHEGQGGASVKGCQGLKATADLPGLASSQACATQRRASAKRACDNGPLSIWQDVQVQMRGV